MKNFHEINEKAIRGGIVFWGSTYLSEVPVMELARDYEIDSPVYNRSVPGMKISDMEGRMQDCVCELQPEKVVLCVGEEEVSEEHFDEKAFLSSYEWILYELHQKTGAEIVILPVQSEHFNALKVNEGLKKIAENYGCRYVESAAFFPGRSLARFFKSITPHLRNHPLSFFEAMNLIG